MQIQINLFYLLLYFVTKSWILFLNFNSRMWSLSKELVFYLFSQNNFTFDIIEMKWIYGKSNFILRTADVGTAFLNAPIKTPYYVYPPTDIGLPEGKCWKLKRALYGLRGAPRAWYEHVCSYLASLGFSRLLTDPSVFVRGKGEKQVMVLLYVDDMLFSGGSPSTPCQQNSFLRFQTSCVKKTTLLKC